jgi:acetyltransferase
MKSLKSFFDPGTVALVGATDKEGTVGRIVLENLLLAKDKRKIYPVNPGIEKVLDVECYGDVSSVPELPDLAIIASPAEIVPEVLEECGKAGVKAIIIISAGFKEMGAEGKARENKMADTARKYNIRLMGPNCMGLIRPSASLNATFAKRIPKPGYVAFLSQSSALGSAVLDWAITRDIGFSAFVSLGSMLDVDFGDLIDYFGEDRETRSIIIYLESVGNAKKFVSATRGFARTKPIVVLKPGRYQESERAAESLTGAVLGEDMCYDAVFRRAGAMRVEEIEDLFNCASILNTAQLPKGPNLAIITNAGGPAVLATDALVSRGGRLAELSQASLSALSAFLPPHWSRSNPIDILPDADSRRYSNTVQTVIKDAGVDGAVVIYAPQGGASPTEAAQAIVEHAKEGNKPILTAWMGDEEVAEARQLLYRSRIPTYDFPERAVRTYLYMYQYARNLEMLYETPEELPLDMAPPKNHLKVMVRKAADQGRTLLSEEESKQFLKIYGISSTTPYVARDAEDAARIASAIGYPVAMKISSPDIVRKSDIGGVVLNLSASEEVKKAFSEIVENVKKCRPDARIEGVNVQEMITNYDYELTLGTRKDPVFGPVIVFGLGGMEAEFFGGIAVGLPPLNQLLARRVLEQASIHRVLSQGFKGKPPANLRLLEETLVKFSNLIIDFPEIKEVVISPLAANTNAVVALDARITLDEEAIQKGIQEYAHLIIPPYPTRYVQPWKCRDGRSVLLRPIRPEDELLERQLIAGLSEEAMRFRFFYIIKELTHDMLTRFCNIDYDREMAIIAEYTSDGKRRNVGVGRLIIDPIGETGEFAILVAEDFQSNGLGLKLLDTLIGIGEEKGLSNIYGMVLNANTKMMGLAKRLGFTMEPVSPEESKVTLELWSRP